MKYKVRDHFWLHGIRNEPVEPGTVLELTPEQAAAHAHQIEPVIEPAPKAAPAKGKGRAD